MEQPIPSQRLARLLSSTAIAVCLSVALPAVPDFDLPAKPAFADDDGGEGGEGGGGGEGGEGGGGGEGGEGGEGGGGRGGGDGASSDGGRGNDGGGEGGEGGDGASSDGDRGNDGEGEGGEGGEGGDDGDAGEGGDAAGAGEDGLILGLESGDDGDRRGFGLDSLSSLSTTANANRLLWILPPDEVAAAAPGRDPAAADGTGLARAPATPPGGNGLSAPPQAVTAVEGGPKVVGRPLPPDSALAAPPKLAPTPGSKPLAVRLAPVPAVKPVETAALPEANGGTGDGPAPVASALGGLPEPKLEAESPAALSEKPPAAESPDEAAVASLRSWKPAASSPEAPAAEAPALEAAEDAASPPPVAPAPEEESAGAQPAYDFGPGGQEVRLPAPGAAPSEARLQTREAEASGPVGTAEPSGLGERLRGAVDRAIGWGTRLFSDAEETEDEEG